MGVLLVSHNQLATATTLTRWAFDGAVDSVVGLSSTVGSGAHMDSTLDSTVDSSSTVDSVADGGGRDQCLFASVVLLTRFVSSNHAVRMTTVPGFVP